MYSRKLIEVALPLEAINAEGSHRKRKAPAGYPTTLHKWWAQRPVAAARAVLFAQMVDDPSAYIDDLRSDVVILRKARAQLKGRLKLWQQTKHLAEKATGSGLSVAEPGLPPTLEDSLADIERHRLFQIIEQLVRWEATKDERVMQAARDEIWQSWRRSCARNAADPRAAELYDRKSLPAVHDPFAGSGALPLEAQRLGLDSYASDLNPVAVLINKGMIELAGRFAGRAPVSVSAPTQRDLPIDQTEGFAGLAEDVRFYSRRMRDEAYRRIGSLYPEVTVTPKLAQERPDLIDYVGQSLTVCAYLWARTVKSPNPAFSDVDVPLMSTFMLSTKPGKEAYVQPAIDGRRYSFKVIVGKPANPELAKSGTKLTRANFACVMSGSPITGDYIKLEGKAGRMRSRLMAIVVDGKRGRMFLPASDEDERVAVAAQPSWTPEGEIATRMTGGNCTPYGLTSWGDLFTSRQLVALTAFHDSIGEIREEIIRDAVSAGMRDDSVPFRAGGAGAVAYADVVTAYLAIALGRVADYGSSMATWRPKDNAMRSTLPKQAIQMTWDFAEGSPFGSSSSGLVECAHVVAKVIETALVPGNGIASQTGVGEVLMGRNGVAVITTDPPYYDNIGYADLSDFFYVWLRRSMRSVFPDLFATVEVPKAEELVATAHRHGGEAGAEEFFLAGMTKAMERLARQTHPAYPITIYYAFKQAETDGEQGTTNTGWDTFLGAVIRAGLAISGTWPMRTEGGVSRVQLNSG